MALGSVRLPATTTRERASSVLLWVVLLFAFSPVVADLFSHLAQNAWARGSIVFLPLAWFAAQQLPTPAGPVRWGFALLGLGLAIEVFAVGGDLLRLGRVGLGLAAVGLIGVRGWASLPAASLLLFAIPLPHALAEIASPTLEVTWGRLGVGLAQTFGLDLVRNGTVLSTPSGAILELGAVDGGVVLGSVAAGLAWFVAAAARRSMIACAGSSLLGFVAGVVGQGLIVALMGFGLGLGVPAALAATSLEQLVPGLAVLGASAVWVRARRRIEARSLA